MAWPWYCLNPHGGLHAGLPSRAVLLHILSPGACGACRHMYGQSTAHRLTDGNSTTEAAAICKQQFTVLCCAALCCAVLIFDGLKFGDDCEVSVALCCSVQRLSQELQLRQTRACVQDAGTLRMQCEVACTWTCLSQSFASGSDHQGWCFTTYCLLASGPDTSVPAPPRDDCCVLVCVCWPS